MGEKPTICYCITYTASHGTGLHLHRGIKLNLPGVWQQHLAGACSCRHVTACSRQHVWHDLTSVWLE